MKYITSKGYLALTEANNRNKDSGKGSSSRKNDDDVLVLGTVARQTEKEPERQPPETWNVTKSRGFKKSNISNVDQRNNERVDLRKMETTLLLQMQTSVHIWERL